MKKIESYMESADRSDKYGKEELVNFIHSSLLNVFKLIESKRFKELELYVARLSFLFKKIVSQLESKAKEKWKMIFMQNPLSSRWICSDGKPESLPQVPREDPKICCHLIE